MTTTPYSALTLDQSVITLQASTVDAMIALWKKQGRRATALDFAERFTDLVRVTVEHMDDDGEFD